MKKVRFAEVVRDLPRHTHDLTRREVAASQRWRILEAVTEVTARMGYGAASVADVIAAAGVSRKTFYEHFDDKEECFLSAYDVLSERLVRALDAVGREEEPGPTRRRVQLATFLRALAKDPAPARVFMVDVLGAGPRALARRERLNARFADVVLGEVTKDRVRRTAIIGGINNVVAGLLLTGRPSEIESLLGPLAAFLEAAVT